ncbi:MAG TPA: 2-amino-4-hydroxy-6-hydroxymethyldihydropteridine diphosphokinase [Bryobacteraceae bacterium]|nr:2-amino-4-hydroxy-6-hydroxymethyldihydropteridine diphosphokinase [Bryobacteraceae bacterium]
MKLVYLALGSNLGDRAENLRLAREQIEAPDLHVLRASSIYETAPRDVEDQPWFLNQVLECETDLFPRQLLGRLQKIERKMGRKRTIAKGPREIDLDILLFGNAVVKAPELEVPHPRLPERRFVLEPLTELAPDKKHPGTRRTMREMLARVMDQKVKKLQKGV